MNLEPTVEDARSRGKNRLAKEALEGVTKVSDGAEELLCVGAYPGTLRSSQ